VPSTPADPPQHAGSEPPAALSKAEQWRRDTIAASGLFDEDWYRSQLSDGTEAAADPLTHYVATGYEQGLSANAGFDPEWYKQQPDTPNRFEADPLLHYIRKGGPRGESPHPKFDAAVYAEDYPDCLTHPGGPLGHYLYSGTWDADHSSSDPERLARAAKWLDPRVFAKGARQVAGVMYATRGYAHLDREAETFDFQAESAFKQTLRSEAPLPDPAPLVSVILPTLDRADMLPTALDSVMDQTYPHWQLIIVDDGSRDHTDQVVQPYLDDPRVTYLKHEGSRGVAAARNTALEVATGDYIAYMDSDNSWYIDFLELILRFIHRDGHQVAYAMSALIEQGGHERRLYRGAPFVRDALDERNFIDCIVLVHERALLDTTGGFDEGLRRNVDWDLFIRLARITDFGFAPFIATEYDIWESRTERITSDELPNYRYRVRERTLVDWQQLRAELDTRDERLVSVIVPAISEASVVRNAVDRLLQTADRRVEVVIVDSRLSEIESTELHFAYADTDNVIIHRLTQSLPLEVTRNVGAAVARGGILAFLPEAAWCEPGWLAPLVEALDHAVVVQPLVLTRGGAVWSAGASALANGTMVQDYRHFAGDAPEVRGLRRQVMAVSALCMAVRASDFVHYEGFDPLYVRHYTGTDLSLRLTTATGGVALCAGDSVVSQSVELPAPSSSSSLMAARNNDRLLVETWEEQLRTAVNPSGAANYSVIGFERPDSTQLEATPVYAHARAERPLRWAIKIGPPTVDRRSNWGDWHFALSLRESLERLGHEVTIDCKNEWYRPTAHLDDVVLVLRGVSRYEVNPGHINVCWVISHPDRVEVQEVNDYDIVFGASKRWCERYSPKVRPPVESLLQCTNHRQFHPVPPDHSRAHTVLTVANARGVRSSVAAALEAGIVPTVYGLRWEGLLPEGAWMADYLPNEKLPAVYSAAGVVLNDHWPDMLEEGLLSNRLFDLAACEARVISDYMPEIPEVFGDVVLTYRSARDMPELVSTHLNETSERRHAREKFGQYVREHHTFDARAQTLSDRVVQLWPGALAWAK